MKRRMLDIIANLTEHQRVALLFMLLGVGFYIGGLLQWLESH